MGAALHLAEVHQEMVKKRRPKRTGGGNSSEFATIAHRIYQDTRADTRSRQLLLAVAYAVTMAPIDEAVPEWSSTYRAICSAIGDSIRDWGGLRSRLCDDLPRYERPGSRLGTDRMDRLCSGPRVRPHPDGPDDFRNRLKVCGAPAQDLAVEKDLVTGWHTNHWFCTRHGDQLIRVRAQVKGQNERAPEPIPNRGGLLPCYFDSDWVELYRWALHSDTWNPPGYGVRADDWPVPGRDPVAPRARLRLAALDGELLDGGA
jgi:hypothetical protein